MKRRFAAGTSPLETSLNIPISKPLLAMIAKSWMSVKAIVKYPTSAAPKRLDRKIKKK